MENINIMQYETYHEEEIMDLYKAVGWSNYYDNPEMLKNAYANSLFILGAYDKDKLVGIIRVVGDGYSIMYIQDILVLPSYQLQKIGTRLLTSILEKYKDVYQKILLTENTEKTASFYKSIGFTNVAEMGCLSFAFCPTLL